MVSILAEAGCTLINPSGPPCLPTDHNKLRRHLHHAFSFSDNASALRSDFLAGLSSYIQSPKNLHRILKPSRSDGLGPTGESLVRHLLLVPSIQLDLQNMLLEKLPEYFHVYSEHSESSSLSLENDVARLIVNHFRWLDFIVDPNAFTEKLMQVLSICPLHLKKEIIGSLPEIIGDQSNKTVVESLELILQEDSSIVVAVLDSFSNLNLDEELQEQVITIALSCIRTIDVEHMPFLLRFLLLSATAANVGRIISQIREQLKFVGLSNACAMQQKKLKGKSHKDSSEALILDALRSSLRFKNMLCQEILKELNSLHKPRDHKVIDIWLLMLIYMNGELLQKRVEKIFKKKIVEDCIHQAMFDQCIGGLKDLVKEYLPSFISLTEYLLACKEKKAREFGISVYTSMFKEFVDSYSRQEVLGSLVTLVGSGVSYVVSSALETLGFLASKNAQELIPFSPHISGILDYLEGFNVENLHKVYEVFSQLALFARSSADSYRSSFANELLMIVRKQVGHTDLKYKKMGLIGTLKIVSCLGDAKNATSPSLSQKSNSEEALELLKMSLDSCKQLPLSLVMFYDELTELMDSEALHPTITEWVGKHVGEFESMYLSDLDGGQLPNKETYCGLEGELWMNLDGDISPICLNILPLVSASLQSTSLQVLPANFLLLSTIERLTNQGSLGGIDALLGCPLHLPSSKYFLGTGWKSLSGKQKQTVCLSLYYAANWIRELLNAFCTQIAGGFEFTSQTTKEDIITKLLKRLRNLVFLEGLLNHYIGRYTLSLPELHIYLDHSGSSLLNPQSHQVKHVEKKREHNKTNVEIPSDKKRTRKNLSKACTSSDSNEKLRQPTIIDVYRKAGAITSQDMPNETSSGLSSKERSTESSEQRPHDSNEPVVVDISSVAKALEGQRSKFRCLLVQCFSILTLSKGQDSCCSDPAAELPLYLYLLRDLHYKLDYFSPRKLFSGRVFSAPVGFTRMTISQFLSKITPVFPFLKRHLDSAICLLKEGDENCQEHWKTQFTFAGNPDIPIFELSKSSMSTMVFKEILHCFREIINLPDILMNKEILLYLLEAFQLGKIPEHFFSSMQLTLLPGTAEYLYVGAYLFVESVLDEACCFSFMLASESILTLELIVTSFRKFLDKLREENGNQMHSGIQGALDLLRTKLGSSAEKLLKHNWESEHLENGWKNKGEMVQKILHIYLESSDSTSALLDEIAQSILAQELVSENAEEENNPGFSTLNSTTFIVWYRVLHERNMTVLNRLVKEVIFLAKSRASAQHETIIELLANLQHSVNVVVSLVSLCRTSNKMTVHAMAVKYGGKFVDSFLKVFDFLRAQFEGHKECIIQMVKELQKATRTIQTLCSEAKGLKQTVITSKIPATKRSMERYLFHVKALLYTTPSGCKFWMGNLKHKDLTGQIVSSQAYVDDPGDSDTLDPTEAVNKNTPISAASEDEAETER
uniref:Fanconi anemia group D2 protein n=1 Tax=Cannabis sativa TaxID=3483 RepID=A0A803QII1_CANSA